MHVWVVVLALLALAVFFLFISLFLKDNQNEEEIDELAEGLLELNREVYSLKKKNSRIRRNNCIQRTIS